MNFFFKLHFSEEENVSYKRIIWNNKCTWGSQERLLWYIKGCQVMKKSLSKEFESYNCARVPGNYYGLENKTV